VEDYVNGASVEDLIVAYGVNRTTVYAHLDRGGVTRATRPRKLSHAYTSSRRSTIARHDLLSDSS
jgi:hypothetical protein